MKALSIITTSLLLSAGVSHAAWNLVHDFEGTREQNLSKMYFDLHVPMDPEWGGYSPLVTFPEDPTDASNKVFFVKPTGVGLSQGWLESYLFMPLGDNAVQEGNIGTLYWEFYTESLESNAATIGFSVFDIGPGDPPYRPDGWGEGSQDLPLANKQNMNWQSYSAVMAFETGEAGARGFAFDEALFPSHTWISVWLVADTTTDTYELYTASAATNGEVVQLEGFRLNDNNEIESSKTFNFRYNEFSEPLRNVFFGTLGGPPEEPWAWDPIYTDNYYVDPTGKNLTVPTSGGESECWAGWCDDSADNYIDTGSSFLGWIYIGPDGWIYNDQVNWVYLPEGNVTNSGAWTYIPR